jgi:hypothetical protein
MGEKGESIILTAEAYALLQIYDQVQVTMSELKQRISFQEKEKKKKNKTANAKEQVLEKHFCDFTLN